jgi:uncharacterized cupin superfamily protein
MSADIIDFAHLGPAEATAPAADRLISGSPVQQLSNAFSDPEQRFHVGRWSSTAGSWRVRYTEWELCHLLSGKVRLIAEGGRDWLFIAGSTFLVPSGFKGVWEVLEPCEKIYAIYERG